jgi:CRISPR-associated protein Csa3
VRVDILVASFGFDIDFVVRRLGVKKYSEIVLLAIRTEGFSRVEKSYYALAHICATAKIGCKLVPLQLSGLIRSIYSILLEKLNMSSDTQIDLYLTGGPRVLVISSLLASLLLPDVLAERVSIVVEGEGFDYSWSTKTDRLIALLHLDRRSREVLMTVATLGKATLSEVSSKTNIPKATAYRRLKELEERKIICQQGELYELCEDFKYIL